MTDALMERLLRGFAAAHGGRPDGVARAPGRVNLIGEHTDYNDGFALPTALERETRVAFRPRRDGRVRAVALDFGAELDEFVPAASLERAPGGGWRDYLRGLFRELVRRDGVAPGMDLAVAGDVPRGAGLSSSASLEVALARAAAACAGAPWDPVVAALAGQAAENDFVGVRCGNLDQLASAGAVAGAALLIDCRTLALRPVPLPAGWAVLVVQSGVERGLVDGAYNRRRAQCESAARALGVAALRDASPAALDGAAGTMDPETFRRARHVVTENARTLAAAAALGRGDLAELGRLMREGHASQAVDFGITVPETDRLAALLNDALGPAGGARQTGGGFGGAVVALAEEARVDELRARVLRDYRTPAGAARDVLVSRAAAGAGLMTMDETSHLPRV